MTTSFHPARLRRQLCRPDTRGYHRHLLNGDQPWDLSNIKVIHARRGGEERRSERDYDLLGGAEALRDELLAIVRRQGLSVEVFGQHAAISLVPLSKHPYTEPVDVDCIPSIDGFNAVIAYETLNQGLVPLRICSMLRTRQGGGRPSSYIRYMVGDRSLTSVSEDWGLSHACRTRCNDSLKDNRPFEDEKEAKAYAKRLLEIFMLRNAVREGSIPDYARRMQPESFPVEEDGLEELLLQLEF